MKKLTALLAALAMIISLAGCADNKAGGAAELNIGILQYAPHASLDNCYRGILEGLAEGGFTDGESCHIEYINGQGEGETNNLAAQNFVNKGYDIIIAIATPAAVAAYSAAKGADIPVIFSAVSDPLGASLVQSVEAPDSGATGTSDNLNYRAQLELIRACQPEAKKIGILYTLSEANSLKQLSEYMAICGEYGFEIASQGVTDASEVAGGAASLLSKGIDCICNLTDNNVVNNFSVVLSAADAAGVPCYGSEEEQVARYGCVASETLDYFALGIETGKMAADVLSGRADVNSLPVKMVSDSETVYSQINMDKFELSAPDAESRCVD